MLVFQVFELLGGQVREWRRWLFPVDYKAVIFDLCGVYYTHSADLADIMQMANIRDTGLGRLYQDYELGKVSFREYYDTVSRYFPSKTLGKDSKEAMSKILKEKDEVVVRSIKKLKSLGLKVGLVTNIGFSDESKKVTDTPPGLDDFDVVVESCRVGFRKPHHRIYEIAANRLQVPCSSCIFLDPLIRNCRGAELTGMKSFHVANRNTERALIEVGRLLGTSLP